MGDYDAIPVIRGMKGVEAMYKSRILGETSAKLFKIKK
jgi:hypothetical protein